MTTQRRKRKAPKRPVHAVDRWRLADGTAGELPSAEALLRGIEQNVLARQSLGDFDSVELAALRAARHRHLQLLQALFDAAMRAEVDARNSGAAGGKVRARAGDQTRADFETAIESALASGLDLADVTVTLVLDHWPNETRIGETRAGELLANRKAASRPKPRD